MVVEYPNRETAARPGIFPPSAAAGGGIGSEKARFDRVEERVVIDVGTGPTLEGRVGSAEAPRGGLVICHPHPLYGGDMDNPVVLRAAEVARESGLATLRFNFRGVGASTGAHDRGEGEQDDVRAALAALRSRLPAGRPLGLAGYSFGAWVSSRVAAPEALSALCLIAPPLAMFDLAAFDPGPLALLLVAGTQDPYCPLPDFDGLASRLPGAAAARIEGADHFFFGKLFPMGEAVRGWARGWVPA